MTEHLTSALKDSLVFRAMDLHPLLDHWIRVSQNSSQKIRVDLPSKGFISASLAMVAQAPLVAIALF